MTNIVKKVQNTCFQYQLFKKGSKIILGVSGGPDSVCLFDIFSSLQKKYNLKLAAAHVNYGLRGSDSEKDEKFVRGLAEKYGTRIYVLHPVETQHVASLRKGKMPSENELRDIRYDFFERIRRDQDFDSVAVAHNLDDQVETYLMRTIRGAGLQGLSAMRYKSKKIIRPMLSSSRKEILKYLKDGKLKYRVDKTNLESKYLRNKIRNILIPYLEKNYNPRIKNTIFNSLQPIAEDMEYLSETAKRYYRKNKQLSVQELLKLHPAIQRRVILVAIENKRGDLKNIEAAHIEEIMKIAKSTKNKRQTVTLKGLKIVRVGDNINIESLK